MAKKPTKMTDKRRAHLRALAGEITARGDAQTDVLATELEDKQGAVFQLGATGLITLKLAGITARAQGQKRAALHNWAAAARREVLKVG